MQSQRHHYALLPLSFAVLAGTRENTCLAQLPPAPPGIQTSTQFGIEFSTIDRPNNGGFDAPTLFSSYNGRGSIGHTYRMARTELTVAQWVPFINAFRPFNPGDPQATGIIASQFVQYTATGSNLGTYTFDAGGASAAVGPRYGFALAYCNWLHNREVTGDGPVNALSFLTGAYDLRTIDLNGQGFSVPNIPTSPDARFRLPSVDEWNKAMHYDPNRFGENQPGWWAYPYRSNTVGLHALPSDGGVTNAGEGPRLPGGNPVASYINSMSGYALFDGSGGLREMAAPSEFGAYVTNGSGINQVGPEYTDVAGQSQSFGAWISQDGFRIYAAIPAPLSIFPLTCLAWMALSRRNR